MHREGLLVIFCGPSGVGKGTILEIAKGRNENIKYSVSATTRNPRQGESDGENYFFKTVEEFKSMIAGDELVEWVEYCGNYYGTPKKYIEDALKHGYDVILEIEVEGAINIKSKYPDAVMVFVAPPSFKELKKRLQGRGTEKADVVEKRLLRAKEEMSFVDKFDYVIVNDDVEKAANDFQCVLSAEKLQYRRSRNTLIQQGIVLN